MEGPAALPRDNGELVFSAPWEARAFALAVALVDRLDLPWDAFRSRLIEQIAAEPDRPYYESWAAALGIARAQPGTHDHRRARCRGPDRTSTALIARVRPRRSTITIFKASVNSPIDGYRHPRLII